MFVFVLQGLSRSESFSLTKLRLRSKGVMDLFASLFFSPGKLPDFFLPEIVRLLKDFLFLDAFFFEIIKKRIQQEEL